MPKRKPNPKLRPTSKATVLKLLVDLGEFCRFYVQTDPLPLDPGGIER